MVNVQQLQRQTQRYELADGVRDFQTALLLLLCAIGTYVAWDLPALWLPAARDFLQWQGQLFGGIVIFGLWFAIITLVLSGGLHLMNEFIRRRWLWRSTGRVKPARWVLPRSVLFIGFAVVLAVFLSGFALAAVFQHPYLIITTLYAGIGLQLAYQYFALGRHFQISRYSWVAPLGAVGTLLLVLIPASVGLVGGAVCLFWAVLLTASGLTGLRETAAAHAQRPTEADFDEA